MRIFLVLFVMVSCTITAFGQYPFEKKPAIKYTRYKNWKKINETDSTADYSLTIPHFYANKNSLRFIIAPQVGKGTYMITVYNNNKLVQTLVESSVVAGYAGGPLGPEPQAAYLEDVNGDGLNDLKILIPNNGCCGAYNYYLQVVYLIQKKEGTFSSTSFSDLMMDYVHRPERDIDGDGKYEIITQTFQSYGDHNYWLFNLYKFNGSGLVNVNQKGNYPIMIQLLWKNNYKVTDKVPAASLKALARKLPDDYDQR
jgi:hypothetical protein